MSRTKNRRRRRIVWIKQWGLCLYCRDFVPWKYATLEHIVPRSQGGTNNPNNLGMACGPCNHNKDKQPPLSRVMRIQIRKEDEVFYTKRVHTHTIECLQVYCQQWVKNGEVVS